MAGGAKTQKLKFGHRGQNKSCIDLESNHSLLQVKIMDMAWNWKAWKILDLILWFQNIDDKSVEGIKHKKKPIIAVQFHPEASPGPFDCLFIFKNFKDLIINNGNKTR